MSLRSMLPEKYQSPIYWDDEAAMRAFLDDVGRLATLALVSLNHAPAYAGLWPDGWTPHDVRTAAATVAPAASSRGPEERTR